MSDDSHGPYIGLVNPLNGRALEVQCLRARELVEAFDYAFSSPDDEKAYKAWLQEAPPMAETKVAGPAPRNDGQCQGQTKAGKRCRSKASKGSRYCATHQP